MFILTLNQKNSHQKNLLFYRERLSPSIQKEAGCIRLLKPNYLLFYWYMNFVKDINVYTINSCLLANYLDKKQQLTEYLILFFRFNTNSNCELPFNAEFFWLFKNNYLSNLLKLPVQLQSLNALENFPINTFEEIWYNIRSESWREFDVKNTNETVILTIMSAWYKTVDILGNHIQALMNSRHFRQHLHLILFIFHILEEVIWDCRSLIGITGIYCQFNGKLGVGGASRKSKVKFKKGIYSSGQKTSATTQTKIIIWSKSGSVGCSLKFFY